MPQLYKFLLPYIPTAKAEGFTKRFDKKPIQHTPYSFLDFVQSFTRRLLKISTKSSITFSYVTITKITK